MTPGTLDTLELAELTNAAAEAMGARDTLRRLAERHPEAFGELREEAERFAALLIRRLAEEKGRAGKRLQ